ncbi:hypothetical protein CR513_46222, partial [Mucuna pruriens]
MEVRGRSCSVLCDAYCVAVRKIGRRTTLAKRKEFQENGKSQQRPFFPLRVSKSIIARGAIGIFGLGFVDAGYSGDWSRIGVITPQSEDLLQVAAFLRAKFLNFSTGIWNELRMHSWCLELSNKEHQGMRAKHYETALVALLQTRIDVFGFWGFIIQKKECMGMKINK